MQLTEQEVLTPSTRPSMLSFLSAIERFCGWLLNAIGDVFEEHRSLCWLLLVALYVPLVLIEAHSHLLSNDEIYTVHIAQAPTLGRMLWMSREIDLHPPLHYLLERATLHLDLPRWCAARLPAMGAGLVTTCVIFYFMACRLGNLFGLVSVTIFWFSSVRVFAWEGRPYMLWMCFLSLLLLSWDKATSPRRRPASVLAVFCCSFLMISNHLFGIACLMPFALAEACRCWQRRRPDLVLWLALFAPMLIGPAYFHPVHALGTNGFPTTQMPSLELATNMYIALVDNFYFTISVCFVLVGYFAQVRAGEEQRPFQLRTEEGVLLYSLLLLPLVILVAAAFVHVQFWYRYGACAILAIALLAPWNLYRRLRPTYPFAVLIVLFLIVSSICAMVSDYPVQGTRSYGYKETGRNPIFLSQLDPSLPIVDASPLTFTEMSDREAPAIVDRVFYLTDREAALRYSGYTLFENEEKIRSMLGLSSHTAPLDDFLASHPRFYLIATYTSRHDWLPRALADRGESIHYIGKFVSSYGDDDLYFVTVNEPGASPLPEIPPLSMAAARAR